MSTITEYGTGAFDAVLEDVYSATRFLSDFHETLHSLRGQLLYASLSRNWQDIIDSLLSALRHYVSLISVDLDECDDLLDNLRVIYLYPATAFVDAASAFRNALFDLHSTLTSFELSPPIELLTRDEQQFSVQITLQDLIDALTYDRARLISLLSDLVTRYHNLKAAFRHVTV